MERIIDIMLSSNAFFLLIGLLASGLFFLMVAIRELKSDCYEGFMYLPLALFFGVAHGFYLAYFPIDSPAAMLLADLNLWTWLGYVLAPSIAILFVVLGIFAVVRINLTNGMVKMFFGLTLVCFLFMLGTSWDADVKGIIALLYCMSWFHVELAAAQ